MKGNTQLQRIVSPFVVAVALATTLLGEPPSSTMWQHDPIRLGNQMPDVSQRGFGNPNHCAPCAAANTLCYLLNQQQHVDAPSPKHTNAELRVLVNRLADSAHMQTLRRNGTNRYRLINGLHRYVDQAELGSCRWEYVGIRPLDSEKLDAIVHERIDVTVRAPNTQRLCQRLSQDWAVMILYGAYRKRDSDDTSWDRIGGHYVAVSGFESRDQSTRLPTAILLHDSNDRVVGDRRVVPVSRLAAQAFYDDGEPLYQGQALLELQGAPHRKDGRVAFLETVLAYRID